MKWQLPEPGTLMSAKAYRDKKAVPLVEKLKEVVKNLTIKCVQLAEQGKKLTAKVECHFGREQMQLIIERSKALVQAEKTNK